jgi:hypothetical protein
MVVEQVDPKTCECHSRSPGQLEVERCRPYSAPKEKTDKGETSKPEFAPRKVKKDSKYKDRAEMRRLGVEDEFKPVNCGQLGCIEGLVADLQTRISNRLSECSTISNSGRKLKGRMKIL